MKQASALRKLGWKRKTSIYLTNRGCVTCGKALGKTYWEQHTRHGVFSACSVDCARRHGLTQAHLARERHYERHLGRGMRANPRRR